MMSILNKIEQRQQSVQRLKKLNEIALSAFINTIIENYNPSDIRLVGDKIAKIAEGVLIQEIISEKNITKGIYDKYISENEVMI